MGGIAGKVYHDPERPAEREVLAAMGHALLQRGPDGEGCYLSGNAGLAVRRLASGEPQPVHNEDRSVWAVYDGLLHNSQELRQSLERQGHRFHTHGEAEVIAHLYEEHGPELPRYLDGLFALAVWDARGRRLLLARDRLGVRPLFYALLPDRLLFASEIKALRADRPALTVSPQGLSAFLSLLYIPAPEGIYREVRKLEPGHTLLWQAGACPTVQEYWRPAAQGPALDASEGELQEELRALIIAAVRRQMVAGEPPGLFLSGGLDSSAVAAGARQVYNGPLHSFSIGFEDPSYDETAYALLAARHLGTHHTAAIVRPDPAGVERLAARFDEPFGDASAIPTYCLAELARQQVAVALAGDGGDELFAGYLTYQADKLARLYRRLPGLLSRRLIPAAVQRLPLSDRRVSLDFKARRFVEHALLDPEERHYAWKAFFDLPLQRALLQPDLAAAVEGQGSAYQAYRRQYEAATHLDAIGRFQYADARVYLPDDNLLKVDHMGLAHSLEVRVPLVDQGLVEFAFRLPERARMPGLRLKHLLRSAMRGMLPPEILRRPKQGFNVPMSRWLQRELRPLLDEYLSATVVRRQGYLRPECVAALVAEHMAGRADHTHHLWGLLAFGLWVERAGTARGGA